MKKTALITGATNGIGKAAVESLAKEGFVLVLCGRRQNRLDGLKDSPSKSTKVRSLNFDVRNREDVLNAINSLPKVFFHMDILINNAGNSHGPDTIQEGHLDDWDAMFDINVNGLLYSKAVIPAMVERKSGHIINIDSLAGKEVYPKGNVYCTSKYTVGAINQGMRKDSNRFGIPVGTINSGLVETEFSDVRFKGDTERAKTAYHGYKAIKASSTIFKKEQ